MAKVVRQGDTNTAGGVATVGASTVFVEGAQAMLPGSAVTPHGCCGAKGCGAHCSAQTKGGSSTVFVEGKKILNTDDIDTCGHKRQTSASTVFVGT